MKRLLSLLAGLALLTAGAGVFVWLLARNHTPIEQPGQLPAVLDRREQ